jgi:hypothetical protein
MDNQPRIGDIVFLAESDECGQIIDHPFRDGWYWIHFLNGESRFVWRGKFDAYSTEQEMLNAQADLKRGDKMRDEDMDGSIMSFVRRESGPLLPKTIASFLEAPIFHVEKRIQHLIDEKKLIRDLGTIRLHPDAPLVVKPKSGFAQKSKTPHTELTLKYVKANPGCTLVQINAYIKSETGHTGSMGGGTIHRLVKAGEITQEGPKGYRRYYIATELEDVVYNEELENKDMAINTAVVGKSNIDDVSLLDAEKAARGKWISSMFDLLKVESRPEVRAELVDTLQYVIRLR